MKFKGQSAVVVGGRNAPCLNRSTKKSCARAPGLRLANLLVIREAEITHSRPASTIHYLN